MPTAHRSMLLVRSQDWAVLEVLLVSLRYPALREWTREFVVGVRMHVHG